MHGKATSGMHCPGSHDMQQAQTYGLLITCDSSFGKKKTKTIFPSHQDHSRPHLYELVAQIHFSGWKLHLCGFSLSLKIHQFPLDEGQINADNPHPVDPNVSILLPIKNPPKSSEDYLDSMGDSLDLVPIGGWRGSGRKSRWISPWPMATCADGRDTFLVTIKFIKDILRIMKASPDPTTNMKNRPSRRSETVESCWISPCL